jgi:hypothetical protein
MKKETPELKIDKPEFTAAQLCAVAGIDRKLVNLWLERNLIAPTKVERLAARNRPMFSVIAIFKARLIRALSETLSINPASSMLAGIEAERASRPGAAAASSIARMAQTIADEGWMWAVARSVDRGKPLALFAAINRVDDCWQFFMEFDVGKFAQRFQPDEPYAVVPIGEIFATVYRDCKKTYESSPSKVLRTKNARP